MWKNQIFKKEGGENQQASLNTLVKQIADTHVSACVKSSGQVEKCRQPS